MIRAPLVFLLLAGGCSEPLYDATPDGTELTKWESTVAVTNLDASVTKELSSASGVGYRVEVSHGTYEGKKMPARAKVQLITNPVGAEVSVQCRPATHFDGDPLEVLTTMCTVSELTGTKGLLGSKKSEDRRSTLRIKGDGAVTLEAM